MAEIISSLESGSRPRGGASDTSGDIPSLGGEHLTSDGGFDFSKPKLIPRKYFASMKSGHIRPLDILIVKDGATTGKISLVRSDFPFAEAAVNEHVFRFDLDQTRADARYVFRYLHSAEGQRAILADFRGSTVGGIGRTWAQGARIPLPPLPEQRRIADILDRADDLRAQRRRALMFLGELAESALTRISDTSSKVVALGDVSTIDAKLVDPREDSYASYPLVAPDNIESNTGRIQNVRTTAEVAPISGKYLFTESDVLYSKIRPALNKVALPDFAGLCSADMYPISIDAGEINREFLWATLRSAAFLAYAQRLGNRAQMPKLNRAQLFGYEFKLPTLESQRAYVSELQMVQKLDHRERAHLGKLDELFASLQHRAFQGEL